MSATTLIYEDVELMVSYDYTKGEDADHYGDAPHPGCPESVDITGVHCGKSDITALICSDVISDLECKVLESMADGRRCDDEDRAEARHQDMLDNYDASELA